jgi:hypothetical protein
VIWILVAVILISVVALWIAVQEKQLSAAFVPPLLLFETLCAVFLVLFLQDLGNGSAIGIESRWGGLGRGSAGWRISRPLIYLACLLIFAAAFGGTVAGMVEIAKKERTAPTDASPAKKDKSAGPTADEDSAKAPGSGAKSQTDKAPPATTDIRKAEASKK